MIGKLAFRNIRKSISDYAVYFVTLIIGISVFYVFNAISDQKVLLDILKSDYDVINLLKNMLSVASVIVSVVLAFLVVYASNFLMKRRKKEFGIYLLLGMGKKKIAGILMAETVIIGMISLAVGLGLGIVLSQGMSLFVAKLFQADMTKFVFECSGAAVLKTVLYFLIIYALVILLDIFVVGKSSLIRLLNAGRRSEKNTAKNPWMCFIVFVCAAVMLGHAYWMVTAKATEISTETELLMQIVKGIVSTFLIFWSLSGLLIFLAKLYKKSYFRGINAFTTKEISSRINTNVFAGGVICLLLFITICVFSTSFSINKSMNDNMKKLIPADVNFVKMMKVSEEIPGNEDVSPVSAELAKLKVDTAMFTGVTEALMYYDLESEQPFEKQNVFTDCKVMKQSDYNKVADAYGFNRLALEEDEYAIVANYSSEYAYTGVQSYEKEMSAGRKVRLNGKEYRPFSKKCVDAFVEIAQNPVNMGFTVVPDSAVPDGSLKPLHWYYIADYNKDYGKGVSEIGKKVDSDRFAKKLKKAEILITSKTQIHQNSIGLVAMIVFMGLYLGVIFLIASAALLSLKELSQAADNSEKYEILKKVGVDNKMLRRSLLRQNAIFFGMPLALALIHSVFGMQVGMDIVGVFGLSGLGPGIALASAVILVIYIIYFVITYQCSRRIVGA